jgi:predicted HTH domain antitoxin
MHIKNISFPKRYYTINTEVSFLLMIKYHFKKRLTIYHLNLDFLRQINYNDIEENKLMKDLYFLICGSDKLEIVYERVDKLMKDVIDESKKIAGYEKMHLYLTDEQMIENDRKHYIEIGRKERTNEMIINMYNKNISLITIAEISNLPVKEVEKIIKQGK